MSFYHCLIVVWGITFNCLATQASPALQFVKRIGDARGKSVDNVTLTLDEKGRIYLFQSVGRVVLFDKQGAYVKSLDVDASPFNWRQDNCYMAVKGRNILLGACAKDYPWVYDPTRAGSAPGEFDSPGFVATDQQEQVYVADGKNRRVQVFSHGNHKQPVQIIKLSLEPSILAVSNDHDQTLLAVGDDSHVELLAITKDDQHVLASYKVKSPRALAIDVSTQTMVYVATNNQLDRYQVSHEKFVKRQVIAEPYRKQWPDIFQWDVGMVEHPDGKIYYPTDNNDSLLVLDPADDSIRDVGSLPSRTRAIAFGPNGMIYAANIQKKVPIVHQYKLESDGLHKLGQYVEQELYQNSRVPVWGLLWDQDGLLVRIVEEGFKKGWPALTIKRLLPDGQTRPFLDFGYLYAVRDKFHPSVATYAMKHDWDGNIVLTARPLKAVYKITPEGTILWEAGLTPRGGAEKIEFQHPRDVAIDRHNRIWLTDCLKNKVFCLSPEGRLLYAFGKKVGVDDQIGEGFSEPTSIGIAHVNGREFLYVGDKGNQRLLKYQILEASE